MKKGNVKKRFFTIVIAVVMLCIAPLAACGGDGVSKKDRELVREEAKLAFMSLWELAETDENSPGYGLVYDRWPGNPSLASTASVGFLLGALPGAVKEGWVTEEEARKRADGTMDTILGLEHFSGFYYHFVNMHTGRRSGESEISVIDTALMVCGVITAGEYFGGSVKEKAMQIYERIDWNFYTDMNGSNRQFRMGFRPHNAVQDGKYIYSFQSGDSQITAGTPVNKGNASGFTGWWNGSSEQLCMYVLGGGAPKEENRIPKEMFYSFNRPEGNYKNGEKYIYSWIGAIFCYQYSHAFVDFRNTVDEQGVDWWENSVKAVKNARNYIIDNQERFQTFNENSWGLSACDTPNGYSGELGAFPSGSLKLDGLELGVIPTYGSLASIVFTPKYAVESLKYYKSLPNLSMSGEKNYGLKGAYRITNDGDEWYARDILGIDKGITAVMMLNYLQDGITWKYFMQNEYVQNGMEYIGVRKK